MENASQTVPPTDWRDNLTWYTRETAVSRAVKLVGGFYFNAMAEVERIGFDNFPATGPCILASNHISNLDVMLYSLQKYAPAARVIVLVEKDQRQYVDKLHEILPLYAILKHPVQESQLASILKPV